MHLIVFFERRNLVCLCDLILRIKKIVDLGKKKLERLILLIQANVGLVHIISARAGTKHFKKKEKKIVNK